MAGIGPGMDCTTDAFAEGIVKDMPRFVAGLENGASPEGVDRKAAADDCLIRHGMEEKAVEAFEMQLEDSSAAPERPPNQWYFGSQSP